MKSSKSDNNIEFNKITITISVIVLLFSALYGLWYYNRDKKTYNNSNNNKITEEDKNDKDVEYKISTIDLPDKYELINSEYLRLERNTNGLSYYDLSGNLLIDNLFDELLVGIDSNLYKVDLVDNVLTLYILNDKKLISVTNIENVDDYMNIYYIDEDNNYFFMGVDIYSNNGDTIYYIKDGKVLVRELNFYVIGDFINNEIITHDKEHIVVSSSKSSYEDSGVYDIINDKLIISNEYESIISVGSGNFIVSKGNKASVLDDNSKGLTIPYDFITKISNYYLVSRDNKMAILDNKFKILTDFSIPFYGTKYNYHPDSAEENNFEYIEFEGGIVITVFERGNSKNEIYFLNNENKLTSYKLSNLNISNFIYSYDEETSLYNIFDNNINLLYTINSNKYFEGFPYTELSITKLGNTVVLKNQSKAKYFNYLDGKEINDIKDYEINYTNSIKAKFKFNINEDKVESTITLNVGEEEYTDLKYTKSNIENVFKKINNIYYLFADNKIIKIEKK